MARYLTPPKSLKEADKTFIQDAIEVLETEFKGDLFGESNRPLTETYTTSDGLYHWTNKDFLTYITDLTTTNDARSASNVLYQNVTKAPEFSEWTTTPAPKGAVSNTLTPDQLKQFQEEEKIQTAKSKQARTEAGTDVKVAIKRRQEIYAEQIQKAKELEIALKNQKIYYKVEKVPVEETKEIENLKQQAKAAPKKFIEDSANQFRSNPNLKGLAEDEVKIASEQAAVTTYEILTDNSPIVQAAVLNKIASYPKILSNIAPNPEHQKILRDFATILSEQKTAQFELGKQFIDFSKIDGYTNSEGIKIYLSLTPQQDFKEFNLNQKIISPSIENLNQQSLSLGNLTGFGEKQIKSQILSGIGNRLENYVASLPTNSLLARTYSSDIVQFGLSSLGVIKAAPWVAAEGSWLGKIVVGSGFGNVAGFIQAKTGINLGIKLAVEAGTKVAVSTGTKVATGAITGTGLAAGITTAFAWTGPLAPIIGAVGAFLVNVVGAKVISKVVGWVKDNAQKYGKYIVGLVGAGFGFVLGGGSILGTIAGGLVGYGGAAVLSGGISGLGASFASLGSGIAGFFGALGGAFLGAIGIPILVTLLVFPVVVALILFIINSGAYLVPPQTSTRAVGVGCSPQVADRAKVINNNLQRGFNNYYNKSPDYPELWNATLFARNPNPPNQQAVIDADDMFWCNYMVTKSFLAIDETVPFSLSAMVSYFQGQGKWVSGEVTTYQAVCPGDAIFFRIPADSSGLAHVAIVYSVSSDGVTTVESNAPYKTMFYPVDASGHFQIIGSGSSTIKIAGFGAP